MVPKSDVVQVDRRQRPERFHGVEHFERREDVGGRGRE